MNTVEKVAQAMWERTHDGTWPQDAEADETTAGDDKGNLVTVSLADVYRADATVAVAAMAKAMTE